MRNENLSLNGGEKRGMAFDFGDNIYDEAVNNGENRDNAFGTNGKMVFDGGNNNDDVLPVLPDGGVIGSDLSEKNTSSDVRAVDFGDSKSMEKTVEEIFELDDPFEMTERLQEISEVYNGE